MNHNNLEIKNLLWVHGIKQYELAQMLGITEWTLSRKLRSELPDEEKERIKTLINARIESQKGG